jgi:hypothetical protein
LPTIHAVPLSGRFGAGFGASRFGCSRFPCVFQWAKRDSNPRHPLCKSQKERKTQEKHWKTQAKTGAKGVEMLRSGAVLVPC